MTSRGVSRRIGRRPYALVVADVVPFHGLRFDESSAGPLGELISPPYDVISDADREALYGRSPYNVVRLEEGRADPDEGAANNKYTRAKTALDEWIAKGILKIDTSPAFYLYDHYFVVGGRRIRRRGFLGNLAAGRWEDEGLVQCALPVADACGFLAALQPARAAVLPRRHIQAGRRFSITGARDVGDLRDIKSGS